MTLLVFVPVSDAEIIENWDTLGMRGTGSHDVAVTDKFVPKHRTGILGAFGPASKAFRGPLYRFTIWLSIAVSAAPALGIARAAIDELVTLANTETPAYVTKSLRERAGVQSQIACAEAKLGSARAYLYEGLRETWETCLEGKPINMAQKMKLQLACSNAVLSVAAVVDLVHAAVGTTGIRNGYAFQKYFRDAHVITQHAFGSASRFEDVGRWMLGLEPEWPFFRT
ncbi:MAG: acyl-CoA dehydrogenase family protein [Candidatus Binatia bacterium]